MGRSVLAALLLCLSNHGFSQPQARLQLPLTCEMTAQQIAGEAGTTVSGSCPANCSFSVIWGTDTYTDDSSICVAAMHAGAITDAGGPLVITIQTGRQSYEGSVRNGISSTPYGRWARSFSVAAVRGGEPIAQPQPLESPAQQAVATCTTTLPDQVIFRNDAQEYCLSHNSRWEVVENSSDSVTIRIPPAVTGESMALNIAVADTEMQSMDLGAVIDGLIAEFFPQQDQFQQVQVLDRNDATVAGQPAKFLAFGGRLAAGDQLLDVVGHLYVFAGPNGKLYSLTFVMDTSRLPQEAYLATVDSMRDSFLLTGP